LLKAAELGEPKAQYFLGRMYLEGDGVPEDRANGATWLRKALEQGHPLNGEKISIVSQY
jgi:TPR repeat protein